MPRPFNKLSVPRTILSMGVIAFMIWSSLWTGVRDDVTISRAYQDFPELSKAVKEYRAATGAYPTTEEGFKVLVDRPEPSPHLWKRTLDALPRDPWGNYYRYRLAAHGGREVPEIISSGRDGVFDTEDDLSALDK